MPNEPDALTVNYHLRAQHDGGAVISIFDIKGDRIAQLKGPSEAGLNRVQWNMRPGAGSAEGGRGGRGGFAAAPVVPAADYRITIEVGRQQQTVIGRIRERITGRMP